MKFGTVQAGAQQLVVKDLKQVSGLALDGLGNLYYTTIEGMVGMVSVKNLHPLSSAVATTIYSSNAHKTVSNPYALAADSFKVYWGNQANGQQEGAVVAAFEHNPQDLAAKYPDYPKRLAKNAAKAMGVCVARNNLFFTGEAQFLFGMKTAGGGVTEVYSGFQSPRGCAYDGEGSLYVADSGDGAVFSLPANFPTIRPVKRVHKVAKVEAPASVVVFTRAENYMVQSADKGFLGLGW